MFLVWLSSWMLPAVHGMKEWGWLGTRYSDPPGSFASFHPFSNWCSFVFGMFLGRILPDIPIQAVPIALRKSAGTCTLLLLLLIFACFTAPQAGAIDLLLDKGPLLLPVYCTIVVYVASGEDFFMRPIVMENPYLVWLGAMSGELFLLHWPLRCLLYKLWEECPMVITLIFQFIVSAIFHEVNKRLLGTKRKVAAPLPTKEAKPVESPAPETVANPGDEAIQVDEPPIEVPQEGRPEDTRLAASSPNMTQGGHEHEVL